MSQHLFHSALLPCMFGVMAFCFLLVGLRGIVAQKPTLISQRWLFALMLVWSAPSLLNPFNLSEKTVGMAFFVWITYAALFVFLWVFLRGYIAFGVTEASFREGLLASLRKLGLPYEEADHSREETFYTIRLPSVGAGLQVTKGPPGVNHFRIKASQREFGSLLKDIVRGVSEQCRAGAVRVSMASCIYYVAMAAVMLVLAGIFAWR